MKDRAELMIEAAGGKENIRSCMHCSTRLRFEIKDPERLQPELLQKDAGVLSTVVQGGQFQVVVGTDAEKIYDEVMRIRKDVPKKTGAQLVGFLSSVALSLVQVFIVAGFAQSFAIIGEQWFHTSLQSVDVLRNIAAFCVTALPIFTATAVSRSTNSSPVYGALLGALLIGLDPQVGGTLLAGLVVSTLMVLVEKNLSKRIRHTFFNPLIPPISLAFAVLLGLTILDPLCVTLETWLVQMILWLQPVGFLVPMVIGACLPRLVRKGVHPILFLLMILCFLTLGMDPWVLPGAMAANTACAGCAFAIGGNHHSHKEKHTSWQALSGITEPAIYGPIKDTQNSLRAIMLGGGLGGLIAGLLHVRGRIPSSPTILMVFSYITDDGRFLNFLYALIAAVFAYLTAFVSMRYFLKQQPASETIASPVKGNIIPVEEINDEVFASKMMGDGFGVKAEAEDIRSPGDGTISMVFPTGHAFGVTLDNGAKVLVHIGLDTVRTNGEGFTVLKKQGDKVRKGEPVVRIDLEKLKKEYDMSVAVIVTGGTIIKKDLKSEDVLQVIGE